MPLGKLIEVRGSRTYLFLKLDSSNASADHHGNPTLERQGTKSVALPMEHSQNTFRGSVGISLERMPTFSAASVKRQLDSLASPIGHEHNSQRSSADVSSGE